MSQALQLSELKHWHTILSALKTSWSRLQFGAKASLQGEKNSVAFWDNRGVTHSATFDFWPATRHALRATPHGERPTSAADYEKQTGKVAKNRQLEVWRQQGTDPAGIRPS